MVDLGRFWTGFGKGLGDQNDQKVEFLVFFGYAFRDFNFGRILLDFDNFDGGMVKNTFFSMGGCWCFWSGFGRKQDALR